MASPQKPSFSPIVSSPAPSSTVKYPEGSPAQLGRIATHHAAHAQHRPYLAGHVFAPLSAEAHAEAWAVYREVFPPPGCCFVPPELPADAPRLPEPRAEPPAATPLEEAAIAAAKVAIAEHEAGRNAAGSLPLGWQKVKAPPSFLGAPPKPTDAERDLFAECLARWAAVATSPPVAPGGDVEYQALVWRGTRGAKSVVRGPVRAPAAGVSFRSAESPRGGGGLPGRA